MSFPFFFLVNTMIKSLQIDKNQEGGVVEEEELLSECAKKKELTNIRVCMCIFNKFT